MPIDKQVMGQEPSADAIKLLLVIDYCRIHNWIGYTDKLYIFGMAGKKAKCSDIKPLAEVPD